MFLYSQWRGVSLPTRIAIANAFGIAKIGPTHVRDNYVETDGYKIEDVERALNIDAIQKYTGSESTDMAELFNLMVIKAEGREEVKAPEVIVEEVIIVETPVVEEPKKKLRKTKTK